MGKKKGVKSKAGKGAKKVSKQSRAPKSIVVATPEVAKETTRKDLLLTRFPELNPELSGNPVLDKFLAAIEESTQSLVKEVTDYEISLTKPDDFPEFSSILPSIEKLESLILKFQSTKNFHKSEFYQRLGELFYKAITEAYTRSTDAAHSQEDESIDLRPLGDGKKVSDAELKSLLAMSLGLTQDQPATEQVRVLNYWPLLPLLSLHSIALKYAIPEEDLLRFVTQMINTEIRRGANLEIFQHLLESKNLDFDNIFTATQDRNTVPLIEFMIYISTTIGDEGCVIKKQDEFFKILDFVVEKISDEAIRECKDKRGEKILAKLIKLHAHIAVIERKEDATRSLEKYIMDITNKTMNQVDAIVLQIPDEDSLPAATRALIAQINSKKSTALTDVAQNMGINPELTSAEIEQKLREESRTDQAESKTVKATTKKIEDSAATIQRAFRNWRQKIKPITPKEQEIGPAEVLRKAYHDNEKVLAQYQEYNSRSSELTAIQQKTFARDTAFRKDVAAVTNGVDPETLEPNYSYPDLLREAATAISLQQEIVGSYTQLQQCNLEYYHTLLSAAQGCKSISSDEEGAIAALYNQAIIDNNTLAFQAMNEAGLCNCANEFGYTPIYLAALNNRPDLVKQLLNYGAELDIAVKDKFGRDFGVVSQLARSVDQGSSVFRALIAGGINPEQLINLAIDDDCDPEEVNMINVIASGFGYQPVDIAEKVTQAQAEKYEQFLQSDLSKLFVECSELGDRDQMLHLFRDIGVEAKPGGVIDALLENGINTKENQNAEGFFKVVRKCGFKIPYTLEKQQSVAKEAIPQSPEYDDDFHVLSGAAKPNTSITAESQAKSLATKDANKGVSGP